jgi:hypothetical protein
MSKKKKADTRASAPKRKYGVTEMEMALLEYVRTDFAAYQAEKVTGIHHTSIKRAWDALSLEEKDRYRDRANVVRDAVEQRIIAEEIAVVGEVTAKLKEISDLALNELRDRLKDELRRFEMKDADLLNIATKCLALFDESMKDKTEENTTSATITNIYNILDNSIQEHLTLKTYDYDEE